MEINPPREDRNNIVDIIDFGKIATFVANNVAPDKCTKQQMRAGFESYVNNFAPDNMPPYTVDERGNYIMRMSIVLYILDHITPSLQLVKLKKCIATNEFNTDLLDRADNIIMTYIITGICKNAGTNENGAIMKNVSNIITAANELSKALRNLLHV